MFQLPPGISVRRLTATGIFPRQHQYEPFALRAKYSESPPDPRKFTVFLHFCPTGKETFLSGVTPMAQNLRSHQTYLHGGMNFTILSLAIRANHNTSGGGSHAALCTRILCFRFDRG